MTPPIVIRPEPGGTATVAQARAMGLEAVACPLFAVRPRTWTPPPDDAVDALLLGSANAVRHAGPALDRWRDKPVYAVGAQTAATARAAGLTVAAVGSGGLQETLALLDPAHRRLLRLAGERHVALAPPADVRLATRVVYAATPLPMPPALIARLAAGASGTLVLIHSAAAAEHFARECDAHGLARAAIALVAIAPRAALPAGVGWRALRIAATPDDAALLALAAEMWHGRDGMGVDVRQTW